MRLKKHFADLEKFWQKCQIRLVTIYFGIRKYYILQCHFIMDIYNSSMIQGVFLGG